MTAAQTTHRVEYMTTEDGAPWAILAWGDVPASTLSIEACIAAIEFDGGLSRAEAEEMIGLGIDAQPLWLRAQGDAWYFCKQGDRGAIRATGARL